MPDLPPSENWGASDIRDVMGLNRALNERMSDQADTIRYHADPPVIFDGVTAVAPDPPAHLAHQLRPCGRGAVA